MTGDPTPVPASVGQRLLWFLDHYRAGSGRINCPLICWVRGRLDPPVLGCALAQLVARHESLRTTFRGRGPRLEQLIHPSASVRPAWVDCRHTEDPRAAQGLRRELLTPLDPQTVPVRATVWRTGAEEHLFCLNMHHLVADSWSCGVLFRELGSLLADGGAADRLAPVGWQHARFVAWQQELLASDELRRHREYWQGQLAGVRLPALPFRTSATQADRTRSVTDVELSAAVVHSLSQLARAQQTTLFATTLAVFFALLHQVTSQRDLAVASLFANRSRPEVRHTVGFLANMLLLRARLPLWASFADVLRETRATVMDAFRFQELPYQVLSQAVPRTGQHVADVVFQMMPEPIQQARGSGAVELEGVVPEAGGRFDLELALVPHRDAYRAMLFCRHARFAPGWPAELVRRYARLAAAVVDAPDTPLSTLTC